PPGHGLEVPVVELREVEGACRYGFAGGEDVRGHALGERGQVAGEAMPAGDLERDHGHLDEVLRRLEGPFDAADVQDVDLGGAEIGGPGDRDTVHDPAVDE